MESKKPSEMYSYRGRNAPSVELLKSKELIAVFYDYNGTTQHVLARPMPNGHVIPTDVVAEAVKRHREMMKRFALAGAASEVAQEVRAIQLIQDTLWPPEEPDRQWSPDTLDEIAQVLINIGYGPSDPPEEPEEEEEDLEEVCHRCGHKRGEHAEYIDRTVSTMNEKPQRRACQHHFEGKDEVKHYCTCHKFEEAPFVVKKDDDEEDEPMELEPSREERLEKRIVTLALHITDLVDRNDTRNVPIARRNIRQLCRELKCLRGEMAAEEVGLCNEADTYEEGFQAGYQDRKKKEFKRAYSDPRNIKMKREPEELERKEAVARFEETKRTILGVDCVHCGACCCPPPDAGLPGNAYVELVHSDLVRMGPAAERHMAATPGKGKSPNTSGFHLQAYEDKDGQVRCPFFVGEVGDEMFKCGCGIYDQRPYACQVFPKGEDGCRIARRNHPRINPNLRELAWGGKKRAKKRMTSEEFFQSEAEEVQCGMFEEEKADE
jgi:Fe-S-cluster containining protein